MENLKNGTELHRKNGSLYKYSNQSIVLDSRSCAYEKGTDIFDIISLKTFLHNEFEILSKEDKEIDIDSIEETEIDKYGYLQTHLGAFKGRKMDLAFNDRLNQLTKAVKQLNKKIGEK